MNNFGERIADSKRLVKAMGDMKTSDEVWSLLDDLYAALESSQNLCWEATAHGIQSDKKILDIEQRLKTKDAEIAELRADRDSWAKQAEERVNDWLVEHEKNVELRGLLGEAKNMLGAENTGATQYGGGDCTSLPRAIKKLEDRITTALAGKEQPK